MTGMRDANDDDSEEYVDQERKPTAVSVPQPQSGSTRRIGIPEKIRHSAILCELDTVSSTGKPSYEEYRKQVPTDFTDE